jgi:hypothetical protein
MEQHLIPQVKQDLELNEIWAGVFAAPTPGTAGNAGTAMNGFRKFIADQITASRITPFVTGALDADAAAFVDQVEAFVDSISKKYWSAPMDLCMNETNQRKFMRGYRAKYGQNANFQDNKGKVDFTNLTIVGLPSMGTSSRIWCSPKGNLIRLGKKTQNIEKFQLESVDRKVKLFTDFYVGVGAVIPEIVFCNDQV